MGTNSCSKSSGPFSGKPFGARSEASDQSVGSLDGRASGSSAGFLFLEPFGRPRRRLMGFVVGSVGDVSESEPWLFCGVSGATEARGAVAGIGVGVGLMQAHREVSLLCWWHLFMKLWKEFGDCRKAVVDRMLDCITTHDVL